jgi:hypothetical protein
MIPAGTISRCGAVAASTSPSRQPPGLLVLGVVRADDLALERAGELLGDTQS